MAKIDTISVAGVSYDINLPTSATPSISSLTVTGNLTVSGTSKFVAGYFEEGNFDYLEATTANLSVVNLINQTASSYYGFIEYPNSRFLKIGFRAEGVGDSWYMSLDDDTGNYPTVDFNSAYIDGVGNLSCSSLQVNTINFNTSGSTTKITGTDAGIEFYNDGDYNFTFSTDDATVRLNPSMGQIHWKEIYTLSFPSRSGTFALTSDIPEIPDPYLTSTISTITWYTISTTSIGASNRSFQLTGASQDNEVQFRLKFGEKQYIYFAPFVLNTTVAFMHYPLVGMFVNDSDTTMSFNGSSAWRIIILNLRNANLNSGTTNGYIFVDDIMAQTAIGQGFSSLPRGSVTLQYRITQTNRYTLSK